MNDSDDQREDIMALDDAEFLHRLQLRFGRRLGGFVRVSRRHAYPLTFLRAREHVRSRLVFIGNAAHTLHPVAGQGFNLGLRDVAVLAQVLTEAARAGHDPGDAGVLRQYETWRRRDQWQVAAFTDALVRLFSNRIPPLAVVRDVGLVALDLCPPLRQMLGRHAMGVSGRLPRLARGLAL